LSTAAINAIYGIFYIVLTAFLAWLTTWRIKKITKYNDACVEFRKALGDIQQLIHSDRIFQLYVITSFFVEHEKAILAFEPHISKRRAVKLKEVYGNYKNPLNKKGNYRNIFNYKASKDSGYTEEEARNLLRKNIDKVLSYAKLKRF